MIRRYEHSRGFDREEGRLKTSPRDIDFKDKALSKRTSCNPKREKLMEEQVILVGQ